MDMIYIETTENEYVIPYFETTSDGLYSDLGDRPISDTIYPVSEFMDRMDQTFDEDYAMTHSDECGGVSVKPYSAYTASSMSLNSEQNIAIKDIFQIIFRIFIL